MNELTIRLATLSDRTLIRSISERTWPSTYGHIISQEQIDFMLDWMYSDASLEKQMNTGCEFYIASTQNDNGDLDPVGFCSVSPAEEKDKLENSNTHKLNKLYVLPIAQGTGAGKALLNKSIDVAKAAGSTSLFLQVNNFTNKLGEIAWNW